MTCRCCNHFKMKTRISESGPPPDPEGDKLTMKVVRYFKVDRKYRPDGTYVQPAHPQR